MGKNKTGLILVIFCSILLMATVAVVILLAKQNEINQNNEIAASSEQEVKTFAEYTSNDVFQNVPMMQKEDIGIGTVTDVGNSMYMIDLTGTTKEDYDTYLLLMKKAGFTKYADNGKNGIDGCVYTATYTQEDIVVTVTYFTKHEKTYIYAGNSIPLSEHLLYKDEYVANNIEGLQTSVHLREVYNYGSCWLIQLKNGHFIIIDGGWDTDFPYLIDDMEKLAPEGQKPVVEAWFMSHAHSDHMGGVQAIVKKPALRDRFYLEGVYFNVPSQEVGTALQLESTKYPYTRMACDILKTTKGDSPKIYIPQAGQIYYFCDISIEILFSQDAHYFENMTMELNDTTTWCLYKIEGQKWLEAGDADKGSMTAVMSIYNQEYFDLTMYNAFHHGINVWDPFTEFISYDTLTYTSYRAACMWHDHFAERKEENAFLLSKAKEAYGYGNGDVVFTFPYKTGTAEVLPRREWIYEKGPRVFEIPRLEEGKWEAKIINE